MRRVLMAICTTMSDEYGVFLVGKRAVEGVGKQGVFEANDNDFDIDFAAKKYAWVPINRTSTP